MAVITIRGTLGSSAPEIGKLVGEKLHIDYVNREIIAEIVVRLRRSNYDIASNELPPGSLGERIVEFLRYRRFIELGVCSVVNNRENKSVEFKKVDYFFSGNCRNYRVR